MRILSSAEKIIGATPMVRLSKIERMFSMECSLIGKLEFMNISGSVKDRAALAMLNSAEREGLIRRGSVIIEATSGNLGISLAMLSAIREYRLIIVMPKDVSSERIDLIKAYGGEVVTVDGGMTEAIKKAEELKTKIKGAFMPNQFYNISNREAHRITSGREIFEDTDGLVDVFIAGVGSGGTISGVGEFLKSKKPSVKVIAVEPCESNLLSGGKAREHKLQGIGAGFIPKILNTNVIDEVITCEFGEAVYYARLLAKTEGILSGISSGAALSVAVRVGMRQENRGKNIVFVLPDSGERYLSCGLYSS